MQKIRTFAVIAENVTKEYGKKTVLKEVNLKIKKGELYVLMGPNGSGKTTLTSILASVKLPTSGKIQIFGKKPEDSKNVIG